MRPKLSERPATLSEARQIGRWLGDWIYPRYYRGESVEITNSVIEECSKALGVSKERVREAAVLLIGVRQRIKFEENLLDTKTDVARTLGGALGLAGFLEYYRQNKTFYSRSDPWRAVKVLASAVNSGRWDTRFNTVAIEGVSELIRNVLFPEEERR